MEKKNHAFFTYLNIALLRIAYIYMNGKLKHLGYFTSEIEASQAYQNAINKIK